MKKNRLGVPPAEKKWRSERYQEPEQKRFKKPKNFVHNPGFEVTTSVVFIDDGTGFEPRVRESPKERETRQERKRRKWEEREAKRAKERELQDVWDEIKSL